MATPGPTLVESRIYDERRPVPRIEDGDDAVKAAVDRIINWDNAFRYWHTQRMAYNLRFYRGDQWLRHFQGTMRPGSGIHRYTFDRIRRRSLSSHPTPVTNFIGPAIDNEVARLVKREFVPNVKTQRHKPAYEKASQLARDVLAHDLHHMQGKELREEWAFDLTATGTAIGRSMWDETVHDLVPVGAPRARICVGCRTKFASDRVPVAVAEEGMEISGRPGPTRMLHTEQAVPVKQEEDSGRPPEIEMKVCPLCETAQELREYDVEEEEVDDLDVMGRQMGEYLPRGEPTLEVVSPFDTYPENGGIIEPNKCRIWGQATVRDLDWIFARLPEMEGKISPEDPSTLMRYHPMLGDHAFSSAQNYSASGERDTYPFHALVKEVHVDPTPLPGFEDGRSAIVIGDYVALNDVLTVDVRTPKGQVRKIPRAKYAAARGKRIPGEFWGRTFVDDMISPQRRVNEIDAQEDDLRLRGHTRLVLFDGEEIIHHPTVGAMNTLMLQTPEAPNLDIRNRIFNGVTPSVTSQYHQQREIIIVDLTRLGAPTDIESGINPPGVSTATEMLHLADETQVKRDPRAASLAGMMEKLYSHHLGLRWAFQAEKGGYERKVGKRAELMSYRGMDLIDQHEVTLEHSANTKSTAYEIAALKEAHTMGLVNAASPISRDKMLDILHIRKDINEDESVQIDRAESTWIEFVHALKHPDAETSGDHALVPPIDQTLDAHALWFNILGKRWQEEDGQELQRMLGWEEFQPIVNDQWEIKLLEAEAQDLMQRKTYESQPPDEWERIHAKGKALREAAVADEKAATQKGLPPAVAMIPEMPAPPGPEGFLPGPKDERVLWIWSVFYGAPDPNGDPENPPPPLAENPLVRMRARIEAHRLLSEAEQREAMGGVAPAPAPGASMSAEPQSPMPPGLEPPGGGVA